MESASPYSAPQSTPVEPKKGNGLPVQAGFHAHETPTTRRAQQGFTWPRLFGEGHPYDAIEWEMRAARITKMDGTVVFEQENVEIPAFWTQTATDIVVSKYFRGILGTPEREWSVKQMIDRVAKTIGYWGLEDGYFATPEDAHHFTLDLTWLLVNQYFSFNSPVWFNVGVYERPQCSACQPYRALISTPKGFYKIGEIVEHNLVGLPVYDSNGITKIIAVKNNGTKETYRVTLRNGTFIEATGDHIVKAVHERRKRAQWVRIDQLKAGMRLHVHPHHSILQPRPNAHFAPGIFPVMYADGRYALSSAVTASRGHDVASSISCNVSEAALAGWLQADGFVGQYKHGTNRSLTLEFLAVNDDEQRWVEKHLDVVFPTVHRKVRITKTKHGTPITRVRLYGEKLRRFVETYDLLNRRDKIRVPDAIFKSDPRVIAAYLKSVFQSEGFVSVINTSCHVEMDTISKDWMSDIHILLYGLGIYSRIRVKKEKRSDRQDTYGVDISVGSERRSFAERVGFVSVEKQAKLLATLDLKGRKNIPDLREEEIISIDEIGNEEVYDIQTASGEYLTNNVAVHNCFILSVEDTMTSILEWYRDEGLIFKGGSGSGLNVSKLRSSKEHLSTGGYSSGPVSFMKGADGVANTVRSGGSTRRAAKMVVMDVDHPDLKDFIFAKQHIEKMTQILVANGVLNSLDGDLFSPYTLLPYQNANNSVRVTDEFMRAVENDEMWGLTARTTGEVLERVRAREIMDWIAQAAWHSADPGMQYDTTINRWHTCSNTSRINASNPCSEYMHIDNSACNLASLNLLKFHGADGKFNVELFKKAVDVVIMAQDIVVDRSSYPTPKIEQNAHDYRQLGLGYANLGSLLMVSGLPYDSEEGRILAGQITSLMCGEAYRMSGLIADIRGPYAGYERNQEPQLNVIAMHLNEAEKLYSNAQRARFHDNELAVASRMAWHEALETGRKNGIRNSQVTVLAPTGTIAFMMDCDTTGVEPDIALVKYKKLVGGGVLKLVNGQVPAALTRLGYSDEEISDISSYLLEKDTIEGAPHLKEEHVPVFDCAFKAANGERSISYMGHLRMMSATQPFISGAISKTINLPADATVEDVRDAFIQGWKLGLKAIAIYRDGSKGIQPLSTSKDEAKTDGKLVEHMNGYTRVKLPSERPSITHRFSVAGYEGYLTVGMYPETQRPGEVFISIAKEGSTVSGLLNTVAILISMALQSGVPLKYLVRKFKDMAFSPSGFTENADIPMAKSITDYVFRYLGMKFLTAEEKEEIFGISHTAPTPAETPVLANTESKTDTILAGLAAVPTNGHSTAHGSARAVTNADAPVCQCGTLMIRAGACYSCPNCFATTGVCN